MSAVCTGGVGGLSLDSVSEPLLGSAAGEGGMSLLGSLSAIAPSTLLSNSGVGGRELLLLAKLARDPARDTAASAMSSRSAAHHVSRVTYAWSSWPAAAALSRIHSAICSSEAAIVTSAHACERSATESSPSPSTSTNGNASSGAVTPLFTSRATMRSVSRASRTPSLDSATVLSSVFVRGIALAAAGC